MKISNIRNARLRNGLSQVKLADALRVHDRTLSRWENGDQQIPAWALLKMKDVLGESVDYLLGLEPPRPLFEDREATP
jgi:transcriptional regulator with XRE-family HTH domain